MDRQARRVICLTWIVAAWVAVWSFIRPLVAGDSWWGLALQVGPLFAEAPIVLIYARRQLKRWSGDGP